MLSVLEDEEDEYDGMDGGSEWDGLSITTSVANELVQAEVEAENNQFDYLADGMGEWLVPDEEPFDPEGSYDPNEDTTTDSDFSDEELSAASATTISTRAHLDTVISFMFFTFTRLLILHSSF